MTSLDRVLLRDFVFKVGQLCIILCVDMHVNTS